MATERIVTPEALKQAVASLRERGIKESARTVYDELGGGSMTTIANLLREFRKLEAQQPAQPSEPVALPPALDAAMRQSAGEMWKAAQHECAVMVAAVKAQAQNDVAQAEAERDAHLGELEGATRETGRGESEDPCARRSHLGAGPGVGQRADRAQHGRNSNQRTRQTPEGTTGRRQGRARPA